ncbi:MAG: substrate-binding domain-containing protein, partial [Mailhella sp.]|nr:substrate-binding domain-containing protein [Mailhella sp.]
MKRILSAFALVLLSASLAVAAPLDAFKGQKGQIDIAGGTAHIPVMKKAAQAIMSVNPDIRISVAGGGSGVGVQKVGEGLVHIGNTGRPLKPGEVEKYGLKAFPFAIDGVAIAVNPSNKVKAMTKAQLKDV